MNLAIGLVSILALVSGVAAMTVTAAPAQLPARRSFFGVALAVAATGEWILSSGKDDFLGAFILGTFVLLAIAMWIVADAVQASNVARRAPNAPVASEPPIAQEPHVPDARRGPSIADTLIREELARVQHEGLIRETANVPPTAPIPATRPPVSVPMPIPRASAPPTPASTVASVPRIPAATIASVPPAPAPTVAAVPNAPKVPAATVLAVTPSPQVPAATIAALPAVPANTVAAPSATQVASSPRPSREPHRRRSPLDSFLSAADLPANMRRDATRDALTEADRRTVTDLGGDLAESGQRYWQGDPTSQLGTFVESRAAFTSVDDAITWLDRTTSSGSMGLPEIFVPFFVGDACRVFGGPIASSSRSAFVVSFVVDAIALRITGITGERAKDTHTLTLPKVRKLAERAKSLVDDPHERERPMPRIEWVL